MRIGNLAGRAVVVTDEGAIDIHAASGGQFGPGLRAIYDDWDAIVDWIRSGVGEAEPYDPALLRSPSPEPRQVFGIGLNYRAHADESEMPHPTFPPTFTKFPSSITGPNDVVSLPSDNVDFEVELVVVIGRYSHRVLATEAWQHVAGVCIGQDLSERVVQMKPPLPQFSLGKSFPGFAPMGPWVVSVDELDDPDDLPLSCHVNGELMQESRSSDLIFSVPHLFEILTAITPFMPGDVIFTGTPQGVGQSRSPQRFLRPDDVVVSRLGTLCEMTTRFTAGP